MARTTILASDGWVTLTGAALASTTDFQVIEGEIWVTSEDPGVLTSFGFHRESNSYADSFQYGSGKTVKARVSSGGSAIINHEVML